MCITSYTLLAHVHICKYNTHTHSLYIYRLCIFIWMLVYIITIMEQVCWPWYLVIAYGTVVFFGATSLPAVQAATTKILSTK